MAMSKELVTEIKRLSEQEGLSSRAIAAQVGVCKSSVNYLLAGDTNKGVLAELEEKPLAGGELEAPIRSRKEFTGKRYVFTSAQNNTHVNSGFLAALENYCEYNEAELIVGTFTYNKSSFLQEKGAGEWYDPKITKYILDESRQIADTLVWNGELNIIPTAANPCGGFDNYNQHMSGIIPHAKLQLKSLASGKYEDTRILYTTGTVTQRNYVNRKAGQLASYHHNYSALIVEIDEEGVWFVRQLAADSKTGEFQDLDKYYTGTEVRTGCTIEAVNFGDLHFHKSEPEVSKASWGDNDESVLNVLRPKYQLLHDTYDGAVRSHHNVGDPYFMYRQHVAGKECVRSEVEETARGMAEMERDYSELIVVESNHDQSLAQYLRVQDYRKDPVNALYFLELQTATYYAMSKQQKGFSIFEYACKSTGIIKADTRFLKLDESFKLCGTIEAGHHGMNGANGARGTLNAFKNSGVRTNTGHSHSCGIEAGAYAAGVSGKLNMDYNKGLSSWSHSHIITYHSSKRTIITLKPCRKTGKMKWRA